MIELMAQTPPPGAVQTWVPAGLTALATMLAGYLVYRNARKANDISARTALADQQLAWTQQAMTEAREAKIEARSATETARAAGSAADSATRRAEDAEKRLGEVSDLAGRLMDWIGRVVRKAHAVDMDDSTAADVRELVRAINGGPPDLSLSQLRRDG